MLLPDHERPLSEHERRALSEIESNLATAVRSRRHRRRMKLCYLAVLCLCVAVAVVVAVTALAVLPASLAALVTGLLGTLIGGLTVYTWAQDHARKSLTGTRSRR
jgi:hypothetical protein